jgi:hypothetical protein
MNPPSLSSELSLSLNELSFGVRSSQILSTGPVAGTVGAPPIAKIDMSDETELVVQVTERGWQVSILLVDYQMVIRTTACYNLGVQSHNPSSQSNAI